MSIHQWKNSVSAFSSSTLVPNWEPHIVSQPGPAALLLCVLFPDGGSDGPENGMLLLPPWPVSSNLPPLPCSVGDKGEAMCRHRADWPEKEHEEWMVSVCKQGSRGQASDKENSGSLALGYVSWMIGQDGRVGPVLWTPTSGMGKQVLFPLEANHSNKYKWGVGGGRSREKFCGCKFRWNWCFWTVVLEKTLESPLDCKEIQPAHSEGDQPWDFFGRNDAKAETPVLWPPHGKHWLIGKDPDAGRDWGQEEKGTTEDEMAGWHHWLDGRESEWTPGVGDGQEGLACCDSWGRKESDTTELHNWEDRHMKVGYFY